MKMSPVELKDYIQGLSEEGEKIEGFISDIAIYGEGVISVNDMMCMPINKIKDFEKRLFEKINKGKSNGKEYL